MQNGFSGVGNWMADEILWRAAVHPATRADAQSIPVVIPSTACGPTQPLIPPWSLPCHSNANIKQLLGSGQSLLVACQTTAPGVTQAGLVAALAAPDKAALDAAVTASQITPTQQTTSLAALQAQLTTPPPSK